MEVQTNVSKNFQILKTFKHLYQFLFFVSKGCFLKSIIHKSKQRIYKIKVKTTTGFIWNIKEVFYLCKQIVFHQ